MPFEVVQPDNMGISSNIPPTTIPVVGTLRENGQIDFKDNKMDKVTVDRNELKNLLIYAENEMETRYAYLKDAGDDRKELENEISDGQKTIAVFKALLSDRPKAPVLRSPYYLVADGVAGLQTALGDDSNLRRDSRLSSKIEYLNKSLNYLKEYMDEHYRWD